MPLRRLRFNQVQITAKKGVFTEACEQVSFKGVLVENGQGEVLFDSEENSDR